MRVDLVNGVVAAQTIRSNGELICAQHNARRHVPASPNCSLARGGIDAGQMHFYTGARQCVDKNNIDPSDRIEMKYEVDGTTNGAQRAK